MIMKYLQELLKDQQESNVKIDEEAAVEIARRSRGTPRIANALA